MPESVNYRRICLTGWPLRGEACKVADVILGLGQISHFRCSSPWAPPPALGWAPVSIVILKRHGRYSSCCKHLTACATSKALPSATESKLPPAGTTQLPKTYPKIISAEVRPKWRSQRQGRRCIRTCTRRKERQPKCFL